MLAFSNDYYGLIFRATQSVELFCAYVEDLIGAGTTKAFRLLKELCKAGKLEQKGSGRLSTYISK
jgi:hypothetical protein